MNILYHIGRYFLFLKKVFTRPEKGRMYYKQVVTEIDKLGVSSIFIVIIISVFMGAVITIQTAYNANSPFFPAFLTGIAARDSIILEFSSTIVALILAGKVGSNISSELGTMRITEQIDALEIMGVNSASYLVLPKIIAALIFIPFLTVISILVGIVGGWVAGFTSGAVASADFVQGLQFYFRPFYVKYSLFKTFLFSFVLTSIPAYHGYYVTKGSLEVGRAGTLAVVYSSIVILFINVVFTQLLLS